MEHYGPETYGELIAPYYDDLHGDLSPEIVAERLAELAAGRPALELAIGTGRVALPLVRRGVPVHGIDVSPAMVAKLREKPGGADIPVTMGDFTDVDVPGEFALIFLIFNTLFALTDQAAQLRCFANVARHLTADGRFIIECFVPELARFDRGQRVNAIQVGVDRVRIDIATHDLAAQRIDATHLIIEQGNVRTLPVVIRYAWPSELDLMAQLAGLRLVERWGGWRREPYTSDSSTHVSIYGPA